jgi:hypothetical protein
MLQTVVLYGNSLVLSSIGASLDGRPNVQVFALDATQPGAAERLNALGADVVVFDLATTPPQLAITLCKANPGRLLIAVDFTAGQALLLSSESSPLLTTDDLVHVIDTHASLERRSR